MSCSSSPENRRGCPPGWNRATSWPSTDQTTVSGSPEANVASRRESSEKSTLRPRAALRLFGRTRVVFPSAEKSVMMPPQLLQASHWPSGLGATKMHPSDSFGTGRTRATGPRHSASSARRRASDESCTSRLFRT